MPSRNYRDLIVWQRAVDFVTEIYRVTKSFPREEIYGLTSQVSRAAVSIPSNIAEGQGRASGRDFVRFLRVAYGSLREVETQLIIAERLQYLNAADLDILLEQSAVLGRLLNGLMRSQGE